MNPNSLYKKNYLNTYPEWLVYKPEAFRDCCSWACWAQEMFLETVMCPGNPRILAVALLQNPKQAFAIHHVTAFDLDRATVFWNQNAWAFANHSLEYDFRHTGLECWQQNPFREFGRQPNWAIYDHLQ